MMNKIKLTFLTFTLVFLSFLSANVYADTYNIDGKNFTDVTNNNGKYILSLNGSIIDYNADEYGSILKTEIAGGGRTFVPVRLVSEKLGFQVEWNAGTKEVYITGNSKDLSIKVGDTKVSNKKTGDVLSNVELPVFINNGRTYLPLRALGESLGYEVKYYGKASDYRSELSSKDAIVEFIGAKVKTVDENMLIDGKYYDIVGEAEKQMIDFYGKYDSKDDNDGWGYTEWILLDGEINATFDEAQATISYSRYDHSKHGVPKDDGVSEYHQFVVTGDLKCDTTKPKNQGYFYVDDPLVIKLKDKYHAKHLETGMDYFTGFVGDRNNVWIDFGRKDLAIVPVRWGVDTDARGNTKEYNSKAISKDAIELFLQDDKDLMPKLFEEMDKAWKTDVFTNDWVELRPGIKYRITLYDNKSLQHPKMKLHIKLDRYWHD